jgi:hypothetical protein
LSRKAREKTMSSSEPVGLTGVWDGQYSYPRRFSPVHFTAVILETGVVIAGTIHEQPPDGPSAGQTLNALIQGEHLGSAVQFTKTYDGAPRGRSRPIHYEGVLSADGNGIEGKWTVPGSWSGKFLMVRSGRPGAKAVVREEEAVPVV